jgi:hypothetical protein
LPHFVVKFAVCIFVCLIIYEYKKGGIVELKEMVLLGVLEGGYVHSRKKVLYESDLIDLKFYKSGGIIHVIPDMPDTFCLSLLESELLDLFGVENVSIESIEHYITIHSIIANYAVKKARKLNMPPIKRYVYIAEISKGMTLAEYFKSIYNPDDFDDFGQMQIIDTCKS